MSAQMELADKLRDISEHCVLQEEPYPVAAPASVEEAAAIIRTARDYSFRVLVLGSGSSFPSDFSLHRSNVMALLSIRMSGYEQLSPFAVRILAGTPAATLFIHPNDIPRKTFGGLLCSMYRAGEDRPLKALWPRIRQVQIITGTGELQFVNGPAGCASSDYGTANVLLGSRGRLGMVTAAELQCPILFSERMQDSDPSKTTYGSGDTPISRTDIQQQFDPSGLYQW